MSWLSLSNNVLLESPDREFMLAKHLPVSHGCSRAYSGVILMAGSITKQLSMKSRNTSSVSPLFSSTFFIECAQSGIPAWMRLLSERIISLFSSYRWSFLFAFWSNSCEGLPILSLIYSRSSFSSTGRKSGLPVTISTKMQPNDHISIAHVS